jgi:hypothetical protein
VNASLERRWIEPSIETDFLKVVAGISRQRGSDVNTLAAKFVARRHDEPVRVRGAVRVAIDRRQDGVGSAALRRD